MENDIKEILLTEKELADKTRELAAQILSLIHIWPHLGEQYFWKVPLRTGE